MCLCACVCLTVPVSVVPEATKEPVAYGEQEEMLNKTRGRQESVGTEPTLSTTAMPNAPSFVSTVIFCKSCVCCASGVCKCIHLGYGCVSVCVCVYFGILVGVCEYVCICLF